MNVAFFYMLWDGYSHTLFESIAPIIQIISTPPLRQLSKYVERIFWILLGQRNYHGSARALQPDSKVFTQPPTLFWAVQLQSWDYVNFWEYIDTMSSIVPCQHILIMRPHGIATAELARDLVVWIPDSVCSMQNEESISKSYLPSQRFLLLDPRLGTRSPRWCGSRWIIPKLRPRMKKLVTLECSWHIHWYQSFGENLFRQL